MAIVLHILHFIIILLYAKRFPRCNITSTVLITQIFKENSFHSSKKFPISTQSRTRNAHNAPFLFFPIFFSFFHFLAKWYVPCTSLVPCHRSEGGRTETTPNTIDTTSYDCGEQVSWSTETVGGGWRLVGVAASASSVHFNLVLFWQIELWKI